ncbi:carboxylic ester hydrolase [Rhizocola hellebori]|uniref:Carboxylic ester hydrolase n=1 Tax=Rhizocola hellebori TaxID=1392758 RepID=A0A8J3Q9H9_9ACTN|nr:carboxylesterase family protein [Rhizocola hellebori]GIH05663.1 carboxylic ester hydrolase [Rhizocola hellebori]
MAPSRRLSGILCAAALLAVAATASPVTGALPARPESDLALTTQGAVRGTVTETHRLFKGIPFAAPPVGALRWKAPQAAVAWSGVRDATETVASTPCPQPQLPTLPGESNRLGSTNEDCLKLSVWTPAQRSLRDRPVFVWLHGGANVVGAGSDYNAGPLADRGDIVVVAVNYRLGSLGFLAHPALSAESPDGASGDYGLMDQQAAMRWVHANIRAFGGDPRRVTLGGQSAGSQDTCAHIASPTARGLFIRAVQLSGTCVSGGSFSPPTLNAAHTAGTAFATAAGCADAACLRALTPQQLLTAQTGRTFGPNIGPAILPIPPAAAWGTGRANKVPTLIGSTHDEWRYFTSTRINFVTGPLTEASYAAIVRTEFTSTADMVLAQYPASAYPSPGHAYSALKTDQFFACPARADALLYSTENPVYEYEFNDQNAPTFFTDPTLPQGAFHAADVGFLFRRAVLNEVQERLSQNMMGYLSHFITSGDPNRHGLPAWPRYRAGTDQALSLVPDAIAVTSGFKTDHRCGFWQLAAGTPA